MRHLGRVQHDQSHWTYTQASLHAAARALVYLANAYLFDAPVGRYGGERMVEVRTGAAEVTGRDMVLDLRRREVREDDDGGKLSDTVWTALWSTCGCMAWIK